AALGLNFNPEEQLHLVKIDNISNTTTAKTVESQTIPQSSVSQSSTSKPSVSQSSVSQSSTSKPSVSQSSASKPSVSQSSASKPSVSQQPVQKSKTLPAVPVVVDSFKQQNNNQEKQAHSVAKPREQISQTKISQTKISQTKISQTKISQTKRAEPTIDVTVIKPRDNFGKDARSIQDANRQSFPQKPLPHPQTKLQTNIQQNLPQNIQKLPTDKPQSISIASNSVTSKGEDTRKQTPEQKIGLNQPVRTETQVIHTIRSQEKLENKANSQQDNNHESEEQQPARVNRLAKWIDELCQGNSWDRDDMIFIRF
ncbi:hypothetical protein, partial [Mastigocoleus sp. MO_188.B34]|uniref:hypothetical protein n=1 Tax=Mastigocoleus sp. MO_188.B34 TaxID=3036635 RepID=UPI00260CDC4C